MNRFSIRARAQGFSLVEVMVAMTIGMIILAGVSMVFVSSNQARNEAEKASRQIENGRFATEALKEDIQLAGYFGPYVPGSSNTWTTPDPCSNVTANLQFSGNNVPVAIYGYGASSATPSCVQNRKANTEILVVRRVSTTEIASTAASAGDFYLQVSRCADVPQENSFVLSSDSTQFTLHGVKPAGTPASCLDATADKAPINKYIVRIYYVSTCNDCRNGGDGIPTLKFIERPSLSSQNLNATAACETGETPPCPTGVAEGIEFLKFEYGLDTAGTGTPASFSTYAAGIDWKNVVAVRMFLLARNTETTNGYTDTKTYSLSSDGTAFAGVPHDGYKRHVYSITARAYNLADRRASS